MVLLSRIFGNESIFTGMNISSSRFTIYLICFFFIHNCSSVKSQVELRTKLNQYISTKNAEIGVAFYDLKSGDTLTISNDRHYPMQSVYKFHLALAVLHQVDLGKLSLDQKIFVSKADLLEDTWSPLREKYPQGNIEIPLSELIDFTVAQSDNNGCDILFRLVGGTKKVHKYISKLGLKNTAIKATEQEMHAEWKVQFTNYSTPYDVVCLLEKFHQKHILSDSSYAFLWKVMKNTVTGPKRLKGLLPEGTTVVHKTGTSGTSEQGITTAINDVGIIQLPNGEYFALTVFVCNSKESLAENERIIAEITKIFWDELVKLH